MIELKKLLPPVLLPWLLLAAGWVAYQRLVAELVLGYWGM